MTRKKDYSHHVSVYCNEKEMGKWKVEAKKLGKSISDYFRDAVNQQDVYHDTLQNKPAEIKDNPAIADLETENRRLKERIAQYESESQLRELFKSGYDDATKIQYILRNKDWKDTFQIAKEIGLINLDIEIIESQSDDPQKRMIAGEKIWKAKSDTEIELCNLEEKGIVEAKKYKGGVLWHLR